MKMNRFSFDSAISSYYTLAQREAIRSTRIGIAGAGGLGSNCAVNLVRSGFVYFTIADFDVIEPSNLNRQFFFADQIGMPKVLALSENLRRINPEISVDPHLIRLDETHVSSLYADCDVIVEAFDKAESKAMIVRTFFRSGKLLVSASGLGGYGESDTITVRKVHDRFYLVGDGVSEVCASRKPYAPRVSIAAAKQADVVLSWVLSGGIGSQGSAIRHQAEEST